MAEFDVLLQIEELEASILEL